MPLECESRTEHWLDQGPLTWTILRASGQQEESCPVLSWPLGGALNGSHPPFSQEDLLGPHSICLCGNPRVRLPLMFSSSDKEEGSRHVPKIPSQGGRGSLMGQRCRIWQQGPRSWGCTDQRTRHNVMPCFGPSGQGLQRSPTRCSPAVSAPSAPVTPDSQLRTSSAKQGCFLHSGRPSELPQAPEGPRNMCASLFSSTFLRVFQKC